MEGLGIGVARCAASIEKPTIDCDIDDDDHCGQHELDLPGEARRIDDCQEIVLNEALRVDRLPGPDAKVVLRIREWADATGELNEETPGGSRNVNNDKPAPARRDCRTQDDERDERQVEQQDTFGARR